MSRQFGDLISTCDVTIEHTHFQDPAAATVIVVSAKSASQFREQFRGANNRYRYAASTILYHEETGIARDHAPHFHVGTVQ